jgi:hypothetical protein
MALTTVTADVGGTGQTSFPSPGTSGNLLTSNGTAWTSAANAPPFATGTVLLFYQAAAPTGWTQVTTLNDYDLRLVSGAGGGTGGTTAYSTVFANQTPSFTGAIGTLADGAVTLSTTQMPSHSHSLSPILYQGNGSGLDNQSQGPNYGTSGTAYSLSSAGGGGSHTHGLTGTPGGTVGAVTLNVRYANIIICSKN